VWPRAGQKLSAYGRHSVKARPRLRASGFEQALEIDPRRGGYHDGFA
jgi:hypothetical protein